MLLARIYEVFPLVCPVCQTEMRLVAFITDSASITRTGVSLFLTAHRFLAFSGTTLSGMDTACR
jgi:hypothetical protein